MKALGLASQSHKPRAFHESEFPVERNVFTKAVKRDMFHAAMGEVVYCVFNELLADVFRSVLFSHHDVTYPRDSLTVMRRSREPNASVAIRRYEAPSFVEP